MSCDALLSLTIRPAITFFFVTTHVLLNFWKKPHRTLYMCMDITSRPPHWLLSQPTTLTRWRLKAIWPACAARRVTGQQHNRCFSRVLSPASHSPSAAFAVAAEQLSFQSAFASNWACGTGSEINARSCWCCCDGTKVSTWQTCLLRPFSVAATFP